MLTFQEYRFLNEDLQTQILSFDGIYLDLNRTSRQYNVELYALYDFYVEIFFDRLMEEPLYLKPFKGTRFLEPYLERIDIAEVLGISEGL